MKLTRAEAFCIVMAWHADVKFCRVPDALLNRIANANIFLPWDTRVRVLMPQINPYANDALWDGEDDDKVIDMLCSAPLSLSTSRVKTPQAELWKRGETSGWTNNRFRKSKRKSKTVTA
jgi:hypothetical protein